jgi:Ca-activated chloride channel family protein
MKWLLVSIFLFAAAIDPIKIGKINRTKTEARKAYTSGDYKTAVAKYRYLVDTLDVVEDEALLNLANAYYLLKDTAHAFTEYQALASSEKTAVRSKAQQQLGVMHHQKGQYEEAMASFKAALKADPANADARYNYEMIKKKLDEKKKEEEKKKNQDQNKPQEPSAYAKRLKAQADALAARFQFKDAQALMNEGAKKDPSVMYYKDFIDRLGDVVIIDKK